MKRKSLLTTILIAAFAANAIYLFLLLNNFLIEGRADLRNQLARELAVEYLNIKKDFTNQSSGWVIAKFEELVKGKYIDFVVWRQGATGSWHSTSEKVATNFQYIMDGKVHVIAKHGDYRIPAALYLGDRWGDLQVIMGSFMPADYMQTQGRKYVFPVLAALLGNVALLVGLLLYYMRDFFRLARLVQAGDVKQAGSLLQKSQYAETQAVGIAMSETQKQFEETKSNLRQAQAQILPSLLSELHEKRALPYEFPAVMVRMDINGSTEMFTRTDLRQLQNDWFNRFFLKASELINRYDGYFHEVIGDEILFYFKVAANADEEGAGACGLAVAAVRDLFVLADEIDREIQATYGVSFRVKASIDQGVLEISEGFRGLRVVSLPPNNIFVSTVRMLDLINEKNSNQLLVSADVFAQASAMVTKADRVLGDLRGLANAVDCVRVIEFAKRNPGDRLLTYFRNDQHILQQLQQLQEEAQEETSLSLVRDLAGLRVLHLDPEICTKVVELLEQMMSDARYSSRVLASFTLCVVRLLPSYQVPPRLDQILLQLMIDEDVRVQANAIEAWGLLARDPKVLHAKVKFGMHHRGLANALVVLLQNHLDAKYLKLLRRMLDSDNVSMQAAGCFALEKIIRQQMQTQRHLLLINKDLQELCVLGRQLQYVEDSMVRRRARHLVQFLDSISDGSGQLAG